MSLILEALKKLDRERKVPEKGFLVVAQSEWRSREASRAWFWIVPGLALVVAASVLLLRVREQRPPAAAPRAAASPALAPRVTVPTRPVATLPALPVATLPAAAIAPAQVLGEPEVRPESAPSPSPAAPVLQAITQRDGRPIALINDRLFREGDEALGLRVLRIGEAEVEVEVAGKRTVLRF